MVARVATFEGVNVEAATRTLEQAEAVVRPMIDQLPGVQGFMELMTPNGKFISIALFDTEENARAAEPTFDQEMPQKLGSIFDEWQGHRVSVDVCNVLADSRS